MTKAVLELLKKMLEFGFYTKENELADITKQLLNQLNSTFDVTSSHEEKFIKSAMGLSNQYYSKDKEKFQKHIDALFKPHQEINEKQIHNKGRIFRLRTRYTAIEEENLRIMEVKEITCEILQIIFLLQNEFRIT